MFKHFMTGGCMAAMILSLAGSAQAEPPKAMEYVAISNPVIACNTRNEMDQIVQAIKDGTLTEKLLEFAGVKDDKGEPVCVLASFGPVVFGQSEHIGQIQDHGTTVDVWISNVGNRTVAFYVLWGEVIQDVTA